MHVKDTEVRIHKSSSQKYSHCIQKAIVLNSNIAGNILICLYILEWFWYNHCLFWSKDLTAAALTAGFSGVALQTCRSLCTFCTLLLLFPWTVAFNDLRPGWFGSFWLWAASESLLGTCTCIVIRGLLQFTLVGYSWVYYFGYFDFLPTLLPKTSSFWACFTCTAVSQSKRLWERQRSLVDLPTKRHKSSQWMLTDYNVLIPWDITGVVTCSRPRDLIGYLTQILGLLNCSYSCRVCDGATICAFAETDLCYLLSTIKHSWYLFKTLLLCSLTQHAHIIARQSFLIRCSWMKSTFSLLGYRQCLVHIIAQHGGGQTIDKVRGKTKDVWITLLQRSCTVYYCCTCIYTRTT